MIFYETKKQPVLLASQTTQMLSLKLTAALWYAAKVLYIYSPVHETDY